MSGELLLELLSEEIPARMQRRAIDDFVTLVQGKLAEAEIATESLKGYVTPRRLTVIATGIPARQPDRSEERRGPRVGAPPNAVEGFLRSAGLQSVEECEVCDTGRGEFYFAVINRVGRPAAEVLPELLRAAIGELPWPKSIRFPASSLHWVRPLVSVVCLFNGMVLPLPLDEVPVGRTTRGHRFMSEGEIAVDNAADYLDKLERAYVVLDQDRRRAIIEADLDKWANGEGLTVKPDPGLLDEVAGLVEFPVVLMGAIDEASMELPPEVLATAMRTHQKYFSCLKPDDTPAPRFLFVANNLTSDDGKTIVAGNERVLRARLADARFFWDQDRKVPLASRVEVLKQRVYYEKLGTMYDKAERMENLAEFLVDYVPGADRIRARRATRLAKADLSSGMVGEFPELQGIMGRYYALNPEDPQHREDPRIADAIAEHYKPLGPNDSCPSAPDSIVVALTDRFDSLGRFFWIGERPTGSGDPFALRRAALGIIRIILENNLRLPLTIAFNKAVDPVPEFPPDGVMGIVTQLIHFIADRLWVQLRGQGVRHDLINAVFGVREDDLIRVLARVDALKSFLETDDGSNLLIAYRRAANIVSIEERRDQRRYNDEDYDPRGSQGEERALSVRLEHVAGEVRELVKQEKFELAMAALATLREPVDAFFEKVTVNTTEKIVIDGEEKSVRENRLRLLSRIQGVMDQVAKFSQIEG